MEVPKSMSSYLSKNLNLQQIRDGYDNLNDLFDWHDSKDFITKCKDKNIYVDVAPFKETAVVIKNAENA